MIILPWTGLLPSSCPLGLYHHVLLQLLHLSAANIHEWHLHLFSSQQIPVPESIKWIVCNKIGQHGLNSPKTRWNWVNSSSTTKLCYSEGMERLLTSYKQLLPSKVVTKRRFWDKLFFFKNLGNKFQRKKITGGGVRWRQSKIWTILASGLTYSTICFTLVLAAPALPTFTVMGFTRALSAKFCIFLGMVAENSSVCLWPWNKWKS